MLAMAYFKSSPPRVVLSSSIAASKALLALTLSEIFAAANSQTVTPIASGLGNACGVAIEPLATFALVVSALFRARPPLRQRRNVDIGCPAVSLPLFLDCSSLVLADRLFR